MKTIRFVGLLSLALAAVLLSLPAQSASVQSMPTKPMPAQKAKDCTDCPKMVVIPAGSFRMGSNNDEFDSERPIHRVNIKSFAIGKYEVTQRQWKAVMGSNPSYYKKCGDNCPVENVSWNDVQQYIRKLNARTGQHYRLPSEAEWEYAARAGNNGDWCFGSDEGLLEQYAWYGNSRGAPSTHPVGQKKANAWGLHDMHSNVTEWVQDRFHRNYRGAPTDGSAWVRGGKQTTRVLRGGSWINDSSNMRSAMRGESPQEHRFFHDGFRLARTVP